MPEIDRSLSDRRYSLNGSNGNSIVHPPVNNSAVEFADLVNYPHIRLFRAGKQGNFDSPALEPHSDDSGGSTAPIQGWTPPVTADGVRRVDFSSMCYFYGRNIYDSLAKHPGQARPIGLIGTYWGGTADELWSSPTALEKCLDPSKPPPKTDSSLWYGMLSPFMRSTIKGAIWYQGEADAGHPGGKYDGYNCTFPTMIADWRAQWSALTAGRTSAQFPFGFVQVRTRSPHDSLTARSYSRLCCAPDAEAVSPFRHLFSPTIAVVFSSTPSGTTACTTTQLQEEGPGNMVKDMATSRPRLATPACAGARLQATAMSQSE